MTISFKGAHFPKDVILHAVFFYLVTEADCGAQVLRL